MGKEHPITINGETHTKTEWCKIKGLSLGGLKYRMSTGMTLEEAIMKPVQEMQLTTATKSGKKAPSLLPGKRIDNRKCRTCYYSDKVDGAWACCYILYEKRRRPCPPGDECTEWGPKDDSVTEAQKAAFKASLGGKWHG